MSRRAAASAMAASRRSPAHWGWASARTSRSGCERPIRACASTCARPRATADTISARMHAGSKVSSLNSPISAAVLCADSTRSDRDLSKPETRGERRRATVGRYDLPLHEILELGERHQARRTGEPGVKPDIDRTHEGGDVRFSALERTQDCRFARVAMRDVAVDESGRVPHRRAVTGKIKRLGALLQFMKRGHVVAHGAVRPRHERGRPGTYA